MARSWAKFAWDVVWMVPKLVMVALFVLSAKALEHFMGHSKRGV